MRKRWANKKRKKKGIMLARSRRLRVGRYDLKFTLSELGKKRRRERKRSNQKMKQI